MWDSIENPKILAKKVVVGDVADTHVMSKAFQSFSKSIYTV